MTDLGAMHQVRERVPLQHLAGLLRDADPHLLQHAMPFAVVVRAEALGERPPTGRRPGAG
mgnify:CR=1 FL=1